MFTTPYMAHKGETMKHLIDQLLPPVYTQQDKDVICTSSLEGAMAYDIHRTLKGDDTGKLFTYRMGKHLTETQVDQNTRMRVLGTLVDHSATETVAYGTLSRYLAVIPPAEFRIAFVALGNVLRVRRERVLGTLQTTYAVRYALRELGMRLRTHAA